MKTCRHSARLLSADIAELRDSAGDLATSAESREAATRILAATDALGGVMGHTPSFDAKALLAQQGEVESLEHVWRRVSWAWRRWGIWPAAGALAAVVAAVALVFAPPAPEPVLMGEPWFPTDPPPRPLLAAAPGHDAFVIPTEDPDITIVWLVEEKPNER